MNPTSMQETNNSQFCKGQVKHGHCAGYKNTLEYNSWVGMKSRCSNPNDHRWPNYGGQGIKVCDRWRNSFDNFLADMGLRPTPKHSLDRYPNNRGNYEPGNTRWATQTEQNNNKRTNRVIEFQGERKTIAMWARSLGVPKLRISTRLNRGWDVASALTTPKVPKTEQNRRL